MNRWERTSGATARIGNQRKQTTMCLVVNRLASVALPILLSLAGCRSADESVVPAPPNFVLVMADDMGWGQTGYYDHPVLQTPNLDAMAAAGLRFDRFYAGAPNCSPTRATVLTGRTNDRTGVENHGYALRRQEHTLARALNEAGYATGHFGKWHLNGFRGPGVPILASDIHGPGVFGFDAWLSVTNFFERDPLMSRNGLFVERQGDSSETVVDEALAFMGRQVTRQRPFLAVIWYGTPHSPWIASEDDRAAFPSLDRNSQHHYGELVAMDRSIGALRAGLRDLRVADNTLLWFTSDNGGLPDIDPGTVGNLRGFKGSLYEGGIRVPAIIEWAGGIPEPRITSFPAVTMDILPTVAAVAGLMASATLQPQDGISLVPLFREEPVRREKPIGFRHTGRIALIDNDLKVIAPNSGNRVYELYNLAEDPSENHNLASAEPAALARMRAAVESFDASVNASHAGSDYAESDFHPQESQPAWWMADDGYAPYIEGWRDHPEYGRYIERQFPEQP